MEEAGCPDSVNLDKLYRQSRVVRPPSHWNSEILDSFESWLKQKKNPVFSAPASGNQVRDLQDGFWKKLAVWMKVQKQGASQAKSRSGAKAK
jgi:hypothetical protein